MNKQGFSIINALLNVPEVVGPYIKGIMIQEGSRSLYIPTKIEIIGDGVAFRYLYSSGSTGILHLHSDGTTN